MSVMSEISSFPEVAFILGIVPKKASGRNRKYPCPICGKYSFEANDIKGHCFSSSCDFNGNYISFYAAYQGLSNKDAYKELSQKTGRSITRGNLIKHEEKIEEPVASINVRHSVYTSLLSSLNLSAKHLADLKKRGLTEEQIKYLQYKTYIAGNKSNRKRLADKVKSISATDLRGVPGFYIEEDGKWSFCWRKKGILVPYKDRNGKIQGFQIRKDNELLEIYEDGKKENKYDWISSKDKQCGTGSKGFCHYACDFKYVYDTDEVLPIMGNTVILTEGAMKADVIHFLSESPVIAVPGVKNLKEFQKEFDFLKSQGVETIALAFDMDYISNEDVAKACEKMKDIIISAGFKYTRLTWNEEYKGLDDYLFATKKNKI